MEMQLKCTAIMKDTENMISGPTNGPSDNLAQRGCVLLGKEETSTSRWLRLHCTCGETSKKDSRLKSLSRKNGKKRRSKHFISFHKFCRVIIIDNLCCCNEMARPVIPPCAVQAVERNLSSGQRARGHLRLGWTGTHRNCPIHTHTCICI